MPALACAMKEARVFLCFRWLAAIDTTCRVAGIVLFLASLAKTMEPWRFTMSVSTLLTADIRHLARLASLAVFFESVAGALLVLHGADRRYAWGGFLCGVAFVVAQVRQVSQPWTECGCFGKFLVPKPVVWLFIVLLLVSTGVAIVRGRSSTFGKRGALFPLLVGCCLGIILLTTVGGAASVESERESVVAEARQRHVRSTLVGSWSCTRCVRRLEAEQPPVLFVRPVDETGPSATILRDGTIERPVSRRLWWSLCGPEPPVVYRLSGGQLVRVPNRKE